MTTGVSGCRWHIAATPGRSLGVDQAAHRLAGFGAALPQRLHARPFQPFFAANPRRDPQPAHALRQQLAQLRVGLRLRVVDHADDDEPPRELLGAVDQIASCRTGDRRCAGSARRGRRLSGSASLNSSSGVKLGGFRSALVCLFASGQRSDIRRPDVRMGVDVRQLVQIDRTEGPAAARPARQPPRPHGASAASQSRRGNWPCRG